MSNKKQSVTKSELISELSEITSLTKTQINGVFDALEDIVANSVKHNKSINIPNLCKIYVHNKAAMASRQMRNPATGEMITVAAKPAHRVVKVKPIKNLKDMI